MKSFSNIAARVFVSVIAIPIIIFLCYKGGFYFFIFASGIALISYYEFWRIVKSKGVSANLWLGLIFILLLMLNIYKPFLDLYTLLIVLIVLASIIELFRDRGSAIHNLGSTFLGIFYIGLLATSLIDIREFYPNIGELYNRGGYLIISLLAAIWICDSAAYFLGIKFGKHKLFLRVSPNKSWEGAVFGFLFAIISMILAKLLILDFLNWQTVIAFGLIIGTIGQIGDLVESLFKRDAGTKDSSGIIPGHGGVFDRFDSLLLTAPFILLYLRFFGR